MASLTARLRHAFVFARHIPAEKLLRRVRLTLRRRWRDRLGWPAERGPAPPLATDPPRPLFPPRAGHLRIADDGLAFTFLNRSWRTDRAVDWGGPGAGAADQLWRMNLHAMEFLEEVDDALFGDLALQWIAANGAVRPGAWRDAWNAYALSLRVVVWMQQIARRGRGVPPTLRDAMAASLAVQLRFLAENLETDLGGNHLVKNVKALLWGAAFFAGPEAEAWRRRGLGLLDRALATQVLPDGVHGERSPSYHAQVFADLLDCRVALRPPAPTLLAAALDRVLGAMAQVVADLAHPDGGPALFNDAGLTMAYAPAVCLAAYAGSVARPPTARAVFGLAAAGYFGLRSGDTYLVADCGRIAPDDLPAHGHGDVLSFEWSVEGRRIVVDPGVFAYVAGPRRARARAAAAHNTLCFEEADQAEFFGAFRCGRRPNVTVRRHEARRDGFLLEGHHDGFAHLPGRPIHVRRIEADPRSVTIEDRLSRMAWGNPRHPASLHPGIEQGSVGLPTQPCFVGRSRSPATIGFLLHPAVTCSTGAGGLMLVTGETRIRVTSSLPLGIVPDVWWPDMGVERPTQRIVARLPGAVRQASTHFAVLDRASP